MNWTATEKLLLRMTESHTRDELRKITFKKEVFPLLLRYENGERSLDLHDSILKVADDLLKDEQH